jgi:hypothetical protein
LGLENASFFGQPFDGKFGFYWQADRCSGASHRPKCGQEAGRGKDFHSGGALKSKLNDQGFRWFSFLQFCVSL